MKLLQEVEWITETESDFKHGVVTNGVTQPASSAEDGKEREHGLSRGDRHDQDYAVPNAILCGALFSITQARGTSQNRELIPTVEGLQIRFTGERFNQTDLDVFGTLLRYTSVQQSASKVSFSASKLLTDLGRKIGGQDHEQLKTELTRLRRSSVEIIAIKNRTLFSGPLLTANSQPSDTGAYVVTFNEHVSSLFQDGYTSMNWQVRRALGKNNLAKWLYGFYSTPAQALAHTVSTLKELCGSDTRRLCDFRKALGGAFAELKRVGAVLDFRIAPKSDLVTISRRFKALGPSRPKANRLAQHTGGNHDTKRAARIWRDNSSQRFVETATPTVDRTLHLSNQSLSQIWTITALRTLEWREFELFCAQYFEAIGFTAKVVPCGPDGGVDIKLFKGESVKPIAFVQCKAWNAGRVSVAHVRELLGVMASEKVEQGIFLTTSAFTKSAEAFARLNPIQLVSGFDFIEMLRELSVATQARLYKVAFGRSFIAPVCASCGTNISEHHHEKREQYSLSQTLQLEKRTPAVPVTKSGNSLSELATVTRPAKLSYALDFKKPNDMIGLCVVKGKLSALARKIYNVLISAAQYQQHAGVIRPNDDPTMANCLWIEYQSVIKGTQYNSNDYGTLTDHVLELLDIRLSVDPATSSNSRRILSEVTFYNSKGPKSRGGAVWLGFAFPPEVSQRILTPTACTEFNLRVQAQLRTGSSLALYEICRLYSTTALNLTPQADWIDWYYRVTGSVISDSRPEYKYFKRDHLLKSIAEINMLTDIEVELIEFWDGKTVKEILFKVYRKAKFGDTLD